VRPEAGRTKMKISQAPKALYSKLFNALRYFLHGVTEGFNKLSAGFTDPPAISRHERAGYPSRIFRTYPSTIFRSYGAGGAGRAEIIRAGWMEGWMDG